jgi:hypothetical protein
VVDRNGDALQTFEFSSGAEGELLAVSGGTEPVAYTYNALYQQTSLTDGDEQTTLFAFDSKNRPSLIRYPGASADEGYDTIRFTLYDDAGRLLRRIGGRDIVTEYSARE